MDLNIRKEHLSRAYIQAVAAQSDVKIGNWSYDSHSVDGTLRWEDGRRPMIDFQAKASSRDVVRGDTIHFPLDVKNYEELRPDDLPTPIILVVVLMPNDPAEWLTLSDEQLCMRSSGYFRSLAGMPRTDNRQTRTVEIPRQNVFDRDHLIDLMERADRREL